MEAWCNEVCAAAASGFCPVCVAVDRGCGHFCHAPALLLSAWSCVRFLFCFVLWDASLLLAAVLFLVLMADGGMGCLASFAIFLWDASLLFC